MEDNIYNQLMNLLDSPETNYRQTDPDLTALATTGISVFLTKDNFVHWLNTPGIDCEGKCPKEFLVIPFGIQNLTTILNRFMHGIPY